MVLGYSGLHDSADYLAAKPGLVGHEGRIFQGMDSAAALFVDGHLVAAVQEERFTGNKYENRYPAAAMRWCLQEAGIQPRDVDAVAHGFAFGPYRRLMESSVSGAERYAAVYSPKRQQQLLGQHFPELLDRVQVTGIRHHRAHALSAAVGSGFDDCLAVVMDGMGETDSVSVYRWRGGRLDHLMALDMRSSLGLYYSLVTMHLGFQPNSDEHRVMALAAYGDPERFADVMADAVTLLGDGRILVPLLNSARDDPFREQYRAGRRWLAERTTPSVPDADGGLGPEHADVAAACQRRLEQSILHVISHWMDRTGARDIAFAGGVALNCVSNGVLLQHGVERLFVVPASGDEGTAVGAALALLPETAQAMVPAFPSYGPDPGVPEGSGRAWISLPSVAAAARAAARLISSGAVVGWAQGRLEFGPRALGNRSILADPRDPAMRTKVNATVKFREDFRPLAPAVLASHAANYFDIPAGADVRHMTVAVPVHVPKRATIPAVVHTDGTARLQAVDHATNPTFAALIEEFFRITGVPVVLNTSLNVKGQPMARDAREALWTFEHSALDALFVGAAVLLRPPWTAEDILRERT
ncbi:carbamoyltransferase C-terminal domain-containing protein [Dactylosporangium sp. NPDC050588]|uniref:carbamoyltransferase family protein n=1 Tax=Dactylosporangium sp. NPDC050588 TaxID=3157211 RepID=UPI003409FCF9